MDVTKLPDIVNNKDLTQHFLYTYSNINKIGPSEKIKNMHVDDLIFDRSRKSIFTQNQEFGYINDFHTTINMGHYSHDVNAYLDVFTYEGVQNAYVFIPWYVDNFKITTSTLKPILPYRSKIKFDNVSWNMYGSTSRFKFTPTDRENPIKEIPCKPSTCEIVAYVPHKGHDYSNVSINPIFKLDEHTYDNYGYDYYEIPSLNCHPKYESIHTKELELFNPSSIKIQLKVSCSEFPNSYSYAYLEYDIANYVTFHNSSEVESFFDLERKLKDAGSNSLTFTNNGVLTNDYTLSTIDEQIYAQNGTKQYFGIGIPERLCFSKKIDENEVYASTLYVSLGFGSLQEMKYINVHDSKKSMLSYNNCNTYENYRYYFATNNNWKNIPISSLTFRSF